MNGMFRFSPCRTSAGVPNGSLSVEMSETVVETVLVFHSPVEGRKNGNGCQSGTQEAATHGASWWGMGRDRMRFFLAAECYL